MDSPSIPNSLFRRKDKHKRGIVYSVMLCGASGTGKTTFANNLLESNLLNTNTMVACTNLIQIPMTI